MLSAGNNQRANLSLDLLTDVFISIMLLLISGFFFSYFFLSASKVIYKLYRIWELRDVRKGANAFRAHLKKIFKTNVFLFFCFQLIQAKSHDSLWQKLRINDHAAMSINPLARTSNDDDLDVSIEMTSMQPAESSLENTNQIKKYESRMSVNQSDSLGKGFNGVDTVSDATNEFEENRFSDCAMKARFRPSNLFNLNLSSSNTSEIISSRKDSNVMESFNLQNPTKEELSLESEFHISSPKNRFRGASNQFRN